MQKKFYLSRSNKKLGGVCGGLAEYFGLDSLLVRVAFLLLILGFGTGLWAYIILWIFAPIEEKTW